MTIMMGFFLCVCVVVFVRACVRACVSMCVCVRVFFFLLLTGAECFARVPFVFRKSEKALQASCELTTRCLRIRSKRRGQQLDQLLHVTDGVLCIESR